MDPAQGRALHHNLLGYTQAVGPAVDRALELRDELESFVVRDVRDAQRKAQLHSRSNAALDDVRVLADVVVGAALANGDAEDSDAALASIEAQVASLLNDSAPTRTGAVAREALAEAAQGWLQSGRVDVSVDRHCFHWSLELPEVWRQGGFDAVVGNPPFQGGHRITGALGTNYREHLVYWIADGQRGRADLVTYFALRSMRLLRHHGMAGLLATNTVAQGDSREVGLDHLLAVGNTLPRALSSEPWPGGASLEVAHLWIRHGSWRGAVVLDGHKVTAITSALEASSRVAGLPHRLAVTHGQSFHGSVVLGMGFVLSASEARSLIDHDPRNAEVVRTYLNGEDVNSRPDCSAARWIIDFRDWPIERAREYPAPFEIVERLVKPERAKVKRRTYRENWWRFAEPQIAMRRATAGQARVLVITRVSKAVQPALVRTDGVLSDRLVVFAGADDGLFGLLSSGMHWWWAVTYSSTLETRTNYTATDCFDTFAQPLDMKKVSTVGRELNKYRSALMVDRGLGLTQTYNRMHDPAVAETEFVRLRGLHVELDYAVRDAYGWSDLDLGHGFYETRQGLRYTFELGVRQEILDRLLELNFERRAGEEGAGLHAKKKPALKPSVSSFAQQATIFEHD